MSIEQIHALCVCGGGGARFGASADEEEREVEEVAAVVVGGGVEVFSMALLGRPGGETEQALELRSEPATHERRTRNRQCGSPRIENRDELPANALFKCEDRAGTEKRGAKGRPNRWEEALSTQSENIFVVMFDYWYIV